MYRIPGDYLMTYDPRYAEEHSDSSDFEDSCTPLVSKKGGIHSLLNQEPLRKNPMKKMYLPQDQYFEYHPVKERSNEFWENKAIQVNRKKKHSKTKNESMSMNLNSGDQPQPSPSKLTFIRQKFIPSLSSLFRRSYTKRENMTVINENSVDDVSCQHCNRCERRRVKKLYRRQNYAVQPVYAIEGNTHIAPALFTPKITEPLKHNRKKSRNQYSSCSISSTSETETQQSEKLKMKSMKMRMRFKKEIMKEHWKYQHQQSQFKNQQHQYPSKDHKPSYQVFTSPYQQSRANILPSDSQYTSEIPSSSSGFWEYLFDKINRKYQVQKVEIPQACPCSSSDQLTCSPSNCDDYVSKPEPSHCQGRRQSPPGNGCSCGAPPNSKTLNSKPESMNGCCQKINRPESSSPPHSFMPKNSSALMPPQVPPSTPEIKVQCKCHDKPGRQSKAPSKTTKLPSQPGTGSKPCQEGHDEITAAVADKYNGEILCIHNPPCILINGCLNLPQPKDPQQQMNLWPVTSSKKTGFTRRKASKSFAKCEQACQYHVPFVEVRQCQTPEYKVEKIIQSICHHDPPCEVVRGCYKPKYDPQLQSSCVHVPMCAKIPECRVGQRPEERKSCEHRPRCPDIPLCSRHYAVLTARENFGTQVKPRPPLVCRHIPPCIMIPKCLGQAMLCERYIPYEAIPDCIHRPPCELIPACCRKATKEMVSASSQYPNSCRIV